MTPLLSDVSTTVALPSSAPAGSTVNATVSFSNIGSATTTFTATIVVNGTPQPFVATLAPGASTTTLVLTTVTTAGATVTAGVLAGSTTVPEITTANNTATATVTAIQVANLQITKTNSVSTLSAGQTTTYTITVSNGGPSNAGGSTVKDPVATGLSCSAVTCTVLSGTASCPATVNIGLLQGAGLVLPTFNANSSVQFLVTCGVTATGQ